MNTREWDRPDWNDAAATPVSATVNVQEEIAKLLLMGMGHERRRLEYSRLGRIRRRGNYPVGVPPWPIGDRGRSDVAWP